MYMRIGLLLLLLLLAFSSLAIPPKPINYDSLFQRRMAGLSPVQRIEWTLQYAIFLNGQSRFSEARSILQTSLKAAQQARLKARMAKLYEVLGVVETTASNHSLAVTYYLKALDLYRAQYRYDSQQNIYSRLLNEYGYIGDLTKSKEFTRQVTELQQTYNQISTLSLRHSNKAEDFQKAGKTDSALTYYKKAMTVYWVQRNWPNYYSFLDGYGVALAAADRYQEAEKIFRQCLAYSLRQGDKRRELYEYLHLPEPLLKLNRLDEAQRYATLALSRIENDPERQDQHRTQVYGLLTRIAEAKGQFEQALRYERLSNQYWNRVQSVEKSRQLAEVEARYQSAQKQIRINELNQANQRQLNQINWQANGLIILVGLLGLALWQYRTIRQVNARLSTTNTTISDKNRQISEQAEKLSVLMQELHHRVKNNLAIVSSLLRMQSRRLNDPRAVQAVQDGQRRVEAISLIHQQLYQTDNLVEVGIKTYVTELTEGLLLGYGFDPEQFDCQIDVADIQLDVEIAVPLGLILNEVLTNAFKYAYNDVKRPSLQIRLQLTVERKLLLEVQDNGPGLENAMLSNTLQSGSERGSLNKDRSFGQRLIRELTSQLGGELVLTTHKGTYFQLLIPMDTGSAQR